MMRLPTAIVLAAISIAASSTTRLQEAIAVGRSCYAPIVRLQKPASDFDVYVESPLARIALLAATAEQMRLPFDVPTAERQLTTTDRIWADYAVNGRRTISVDGIVVATSHPHSIVRPIAVKSPRLFLGRAPSHGIVESLRFRPGERTFERLPAGDLTVILRTSAGVQEYPLTEKDRTKLLRVCN
jgi:hypothetical protein